jgi:2,4-dienoyl-CoA reductase-like NADH-dependent reductase (Old Yellow Enzyme family)
MSTLFSPVQVGPLALSHRVVMAPLTRMRADPGDLPNDLMVEYYSQRASPGGLMISEATPVSLRGYGYAHAPGIYSDSQVPGWKRVTDAVHARGGRIFMQLWHVGRQSHPDLQPNGEQPVAPSAIRYSANGPVPFSMPRALLIEEISGVVEEFRTGAERAKAAGFDGVEIHAAMATCRISSFRTAPTIAPMHMAARSRTAPVSCSRSSRQPHPYGLATAWQFVWLRAANTARCRTATRRPHSATSLPS